MTATPRERRQITRLALVALLLVLAAVLVGVERYSDHIDFKPIQYETGGGSPGSSNVATAVNQAANLTG